jgi:hypothetical protein
MIDNHQLQDKVDLLDTMNDCTIIDPATADDESIPWYGFSFEKCN